MQNTSGRARMRAFECVLPERDSLQLHEGRHGARGGAQTGPLQIETPRCGCAHRGPASPSIESQAGRHVVSFESVTHPETRGGSVRPALHGGRLAWSESKVDRRAALASTCAHPMSGWLYLQLRSYLPISGLERPEALQSQSRESRDSRDSRRGDGCCSQ